MSRLSDSRRGEIRSLSFAATGTFDRSIALPMEVKSASFTLEAQPVTIGNSTLHVTDPLAGCILAQV